MCMCVCIYVCMYTYAHMYVYIYVCMHLLCMHVYMCIYACIYIHMILRTHTHNFFYLHIPTIFFFVFPAVGLPALVAISGFVSLLGFVRYTWFFSIGYGLSMACMAFTCMLVSFFPFSFSFSVRYTWFFSIGHGLRMACMAFACMLVFLFQETFSFFLFPPFFYQHFAAAGPLTTIALLHASFVLAWGVRLAGVCVGVLGGGVCLYVLGGGGIHMCIKGSYV